MSNQPIRTSRHYRASKGQLHEMMTRMLRIRMFDERAAQIRSESIRGPLHNSVGQEAEIVGACMALRDDDYMTGNHRSHGHPIGKGTALGPLMAELFGKQTGVCHGKGGSMHLAAFSVGSLGESGIVGGSMPAATGAALGALLKGTDQVCLCFFGDGAANCGPFHESVNLAAIWRLPVIFLCENNGYAICSAQSEAGVIADIADKASSYGIPGAVVDGQDVLEVHRVVSEAVLRARRGNGPTLVEAKTYRYCDHQEDFIFPRYRPDEEVLAWRARDPIEMFRHRLLQLNDMTESEFEAIEALVQGEVDQAVDFARRSPPPAPASLLKDLFV